MSYEGFAQQGYINAVVLGEDEQRPPDFLAQVRYLEGLYSFLAESQLFEGVVAGWCHWDDPFGPDLPGGSLAHMDLGMSVRNKPAEALLKRCLGGRNELQFPCETPPCLIANRSTADSVKYVLADSDISICTLRIDDFEEGPVHTFMDWQIDFDSAEEHTSGTDPTSTCEISFRVDSSGNRYLAADYSHDSWMKLRYTGSPTFDTSDLDGLEVTLWSDKPHLLQLELGMVPPGTGWASSRITNIAVTTEPTAFRFPFSDFRGDQGIAIAPTQAQLQHLVAIAFFFENGMGTLCIDDICFYQLDN